MRAFFRTLRIDVGLVIVATGFMLAHFDVVLSVLSAIVGWR